jgi:hypothetical protein
MVVVCVSGSCASFCRVLPAHRLSPSKGNCERPVFSGEQSSAPFDCLPCAMTGAQVGSCECRLIVCVMPCLSQVGNALKYERTNECDTRPALQPPRGGVELRAPRPRVISAPDVLHRLVFTCKKLRPCARILWKILVLLVVGWAGNATHVLGNYGHVHTL